MRFFAVLGSIAMLAGCFHSQLTECANGAFCPETLACTERAQTPCGEASDVAACRGVGDHMACSSPAHTVGTCNSGVCTECVPELVECRYPAWKQMQSPTTQSLSTLWAVADNDVYAAGGPTVIHYDGTEWKLMPSPPTGFAITGIWAGAAGDVVVVVQDGSAFRFGSAGWQAIPPPANNGLLGIWGNSPTELYAVGASGTIVRFDGTMWTALTSNTPGRLSAVWGSATSVVAAGAGGVIQQYSGANWQPAPSTPLTGLTLYGVWTSGTRLVAVGTNTTNQGVTATKEAAAWNIRPETTTLLTSVWGRADDDIFAVGASGTITHFDGATWSAMTSTTTRSLAAIGGTPATVFAVGDAGTILRYSPPD